jgi:hypothetical protein
MIGFFNKSMNIKISICSTVILLWIGSFTVLFIIIGWVQYFHWIPIIPAFCIASARLIEFLSKAFNKLRFSDISHRFLNSQPTDRVVSDIRLRKILTQYGIISSIGIFGLIGTTLLITTNVNSSFFDIYSAIVQHLPSPSNSANADNSTRVTMIGSHWWLWNALWIPKYYTSRKYRSNGFSL